MVKWEKLRFHQMSPSKSGVVINNSKKKKCQPLSEETNIGPQMSQCIISNGIQLTFEIMYVQQKGVYVV